MQQLAEELKHETSLLVFGRGYNYATALEAALKVGHTCIKSSLPISQQILTMSIWLLTLHSICLASISCCFSFSMLSMHTLMY